MKKNFTILLLFILAAFAQNSFAQPGTICNPQFTTTVNSFSVVFTPAVINNTTVRHYWNFGDNTAASDAQSPTHQYANCGVYTVKHIIVSATGTPTCTDSAFQTVNIVCPTVCNIQASFQFAIDSNRVVYFNNSSISANGIDSFYWSFGDGTYSNDMNPHHQYANYGTYNACLKVKKNMPAGATPCVSTICSAVVIVAPPVCNLVPSFTFSINANSSVPNTYQFVNTSVPVAATDSVFWNFGDGSPIVINVNNPSHVYTAAGNYIVCLTVKKLISTNGEHCVRQICNTIQVVVQPACTLVADFSWVRDAVNNTLVKFTNLSVPLAATDSIKWSFGDGSSSTDLNPSHTYNVTGNYTVCLRVKKNPTTPGTVACVREICKPIVIDQVCNTVANFSFYRDSAAGSLSNTFRFTNTSVPLSTTDSLFWNFGDGSPIVNGFNPAHAYTTTGTFTVCLRVKKNSTIAGAAPCVREICKTIVVQPICNLQAYFSFIKDTLSGIAPNTYHFNNLSAPASTVDSTFWTFGDGSPMVINQNNPTHTFTAAGSYNVCIVVKGTADPNTGFRCVREFCKTIVVTVQPACNFTINFTWRADSTQPRKIFFTNNSQPTTAVAMAYWSFGDGSSGTGWNADHLYAQGGTYTVCLKITVNNTCIRDICKVITIPTVTPPAPCNLLVNFTRQFDPANPRKVYFTNTSSPASTTTIATWSFGDGSSGTGWNAAHEYPGPGRYYVCLKVATSNTCINYKCDSITIAATALSCDSFYAKYLFRRDNYMPNKFYFYATANYSIMQQKWTFEKLNGSAAPVVINHFNPVYVFPDTGAYRVCLRAVSWGGCVKEYCDVVRVYGITPPAVCMLQAYPNPAHNQVSVNVQLAQSELITASVYSTQNILLLRKVQQGFMGNNLVNLNVSSLSPGFYTIRVVYGNRVCYTRFQKI